MLFENDGKGRFRDISAASGLDYIGHSSAAVFFDYDRDGRLDLFLVNVGRYTTNTIGGTKGDKYYVGVRGRLLRPPSPGAGRAQHPLPQRRAEPLRGRLAAASASIDRSWSGDASAVDVNDDGWPDLYVLNMQGDNHYYENAGGKRFVKKSRQVFPRTSWGAMGIKVFDFNNDGRLDIFITDMHSDMSDAIGPDQEKMKSTMKWPAAFRRRAARRASGATPSSSRKGPGRSAKSPTRSAPRTTGHGDRASATSTPTATTTVHRVRDELPVALHDQLGAAERPRRAIRRRGVRPGDRAAPGRRRDAVVRAGRVGQGQGASVCGRRDGPRRHLGRARHALGGHLRSRRRRRPRHRHQRVQRGADGPRQQPEREDAGCATSR